MDNNSSQTGWQVAATFKNIPFWNNLRTRTIIVIWHMHVDVFESLYTFNVYKDDGPAVSNPLTAEPSP
jgi:hypothetical protein